MPITVGRRGFYPPYERISDYMFNMSALTRREARHMWRNSIKEAWCNRCAYCGHPPIDNASLTIDHIKPKCRGGEDRTSNVIPACAECNSSKGSRDWLEWYSDQSFYSVYGEWRIRQWLRSDMSDFGEWDESDARIIDQYVDKLFGVWPEGSSA